MAATYNPSLIVTYDTPISPVRFLIADTDVATAEISDEEITALFAGTNTQDTALVRVYKTAYKAATFLARRYAKQATFSSAGTSVNYSERAKQWQVTVDEIATSFAQIVQDGQMEMVMPNRGASYDWYETWR